MESWTIVLLGVVALSSFVQAALLVAVVLAGRRLGRRIDEIQARMNEELRPGLRNIAHISENIAEISDVARSQTLRVNAMVKEALDTVEDAVGAARRLILRPIAPLADILAFLKAVRCGFEVYRRLGETDRERRGSAHRYGGDDHLFI
jgi:hypothetical protein